MAVFVSDYFEQGLEGLIFWQICYEKKACPTRALRGTVWATGPIGEEPNLDREPKNPTKALNSSWWWVATMSGEGFRMTSSAAANHLVQLLNLEPSFNLNSGASQGNKTD